MNNESKVSDYSNLSLNEKIVVREYAKALLRTKVISLISGIPYKFKDVSIDENLASLINEILSYDEEYTFRNSLLEESLKPIKNVVLGSFLECTECLLRNNWDRDKCKSECNIPVKRPD